jgi:hypothetical protein
MRRTLLGVLVCLVLWPLVAAAELAVCFDAARPLGSQFQHHPAIDPAKVVDPRCAVVTKASGRTPQQLDLIHSTIRGVSATRYLKVVGGYAEAMTPAEQDAVDTFLAEQAAHAKTFTDEVAVQDFCGLTTLAEVSAKVQTFYDAAKAAMQPDIAAIDVAKMQADITAITTATTSANIGQIKTALTTVAQQVSAAKTALTTVAGQLDNERTSTEKTLRCLLSVRKGAR